MRWLQKTCYRKYRTIRSHLVTFERGYNTSFISQLKPIIRNKVERAFKVFPVGGISITEDCNLACLMCHFHGPRAPAKRKKESLKPPQVFKFMRDILFCEGLWFGGLGEFFVDPNAVEYLYRATELGLSPCVLTNGQLLTNDIIDQVLKSGVRNIRISVDAINSEEYRHIRRGGDFAKIIEACAYLKAKKKTYPNLRVEANAVLLKDVFPRQEEFINFWRGKIDQVNFHAEYYEIFKFRNTVIPIPKNRTTCNLQVYLLPSGKMVPCCAVMAYQHYYDVEWLPHIDNTSPYLAYRQFQMMHKDPSSELRKLCRQCEWWIMFAHSQEGKNPFGYIVHLS